MKNFEENLQKLEDLSSSIKKSDITLEEALKDFEEGIKLAKGMEKEIDSIESKIQILMKEPDESAAPETPPELDLFSGSSEINGTRNM
ncbi:MAG: exodeoxyribonuclease VII small subunit [Treponema sp.]